jgi:hypothetical protein
MEEAPENDMELSHFADANRITGNTSARSSTLLHTLCTDFTPGLATLFCGSNSVRREYVLDVSGTEVRMTIIIADD